MLLNFFLAFLLLTSSPAHALINADPLSEVHITLCGPSGLSTEASQLSDAQKKDFAAVCAAYHLGGYEISGSTTHLDAVMTYARSYHLTVQDIDGETWPNPQTSTFTADMQAIGKSMEPLTQADREHRLAMWAQVAAQFFKQTGDQNQRVLPSNLLKMARELKRTQFSGR